jgi:hypothetical protein
MIRYEQWWACSVLVLSARVKFGARARQNRSAQCSFFNVLEHRAHTEHWVITFRAMKRYTKCLYFQTVILSVYKAFKTMSKFFKSNNSFTFDINLLSVLMGRERERERENFGLRFNIFSKNRIIIYHCLRPYLKVAIAVDIVMIMNFMTFKPISVSPYVLWIITYDWCPPILIQKLNFLL